MCKVINTGLLIFDNQTKFLGIGNVVSNTQYSSYINKESFETDIKKFDLILDQKRIVQKFLEENNICVLYKFFFTKRGETETIGFIVTDKQKQKIELFGARTKKRMEALNSIFKTIASK